MIKQLKEYFLGTETRKFYQREKDFYREFSESKKDLRRELRSSGVKEFIYIALGKYFPNTIALSAIYEAISTHNINYLAVIPIGELIRILTIRPNQQDKKLSILEREDILKSFENESNELEDIIDKSEDWEE